MTGPTLPPILQQLAALPTPVLGVGLVVVVVLLAVMLAAWGNRP